MTGASGVQAKQLTQDEYAMNHPSGRIGKRLMLRVSDVMLAGGAVPRVPPQVGLRNTCPRCHASTFLQVTRVASMSRVLCDVLLADSACKRSHLLSTECLGRLAGPWHSLRTCSSMLEVHGRARTVPPP